jgi:hypothetical protein
MPPDASAACRKAPISPPVEKLRPRPGQHQRKDVAGGGAGDGRSQVLQQLGDQRIVPRRPVKGDGRHTVRNIQCDEPSAHDSALQPIDDHVVGGLDYMVDRCLVAPHHRALAERLGNAHQRPRTDLRVPRPYLTGCVRRL